MLSGNKTIKALQQCFLFYKVPLSEIESIVNHKWFSVKEYEKNEYVFFEAEECSSIGIVIEGSLEIKKMFASGKIITITTINAVNTFAEALIFSTEHKYPSTIVAAEKTLVAFITKEVIIDICTRNNQLLRNYLGLLSNKMLMLVDKIEYLSYRTIKQKLAAFLLDEYRKQKNTTLNLGYTRNEMAERLGTTRPSLSREMINMKKDGLINYRKKVVELLNIYKLEEILLS